MQLFLKKEEEPFRTPLPSLYYYVQQMKIGFGGEKRGPHFSEASLNLYYHSIYHRLKIINLRPFVVLASGTGDYSFCLF